ncbi:MAG: M56 family metallopeptidase [Oscillospiraceae bacterium]
MRQILLLTLAGSGLGLALMLLRRILRHRLPSAFYYAAWLLVLLRLALPLPGLIPTLAVEESDTQLLAGTTLHNYHYGADHNSVVMVAGGENASDNPSEVKVAAETKNAVTEEKPADAVSRTAASRPKLPALSELVKTQGFWLVIWLAGAMLSMGHMILVYQRFNAALLPTLTTTDGETARVYAAFPLKRKPKLLCSQFTETPMLLGLLRPLIVLPAKKLPPETAQYVLRHELTHYRRGDLFYKWFAALVFALHWFNPLMLLFRREINQVCELSCDERVLRDMDAGEKQRYGETLLDLAAGHALPVGVVTTTFATEKRHLRERLEQIMKHKKMSRVSIALTIIALILLCFVAAAAGPARAASAAAASDEELNTVYVSTVDEFLDAIRPNTRILLAPGEYDLSTAGTYGEDQDRYYWEEVADGYQLIIENMDSLTIASESGDPTDVTISAEPRYANVMVFRSCSSIKLNCITAGHTEEPGGCTGGVIALQGCDDTQISNAALYGCGILGIDAENCRRLSVTDTDIYECSNGAVRLMSCYDVRFTDCIFRDCGQEYPAISIISASNCYGVLVQNSSIYNNQAETLFRGSYSAEVYLLGTLFGDNTTENTFELTGSTVQAAGCKFPAQTILNLSDGAKITDESGNELKTADLAAMTQKNVPFSGFAEPASVELETSYNEEENMQEVHVSNIDELLAAIAPDTIVYLEPGVYLLSEASGYGAVRGEYYYWRSNFDGPGLVISGVQNFRLIGDAKDTTTICAEPRYSDVIKFEDCSNILVSSLTAGHTQEAGTCSGAVLFFADSDSVSVTDCGLFGCGTLGVQARDTDNLIVAGNEIYQCSTGAISLSNCKNAVFTDNDIHDCAYPTYSFSACTDVTVDGEAVKESEPIILDGELVGYESVNIDIPDAGPYKSAASK